MNRLLILSFLAGAVLLLGIFIFIKSLTPLPNLVIWGSVGVIASLFGLLRAFSGPLSQCKPMRNARLALALPVLLFSVGMLLTAGEKTYVYALPALVAAAIVFFALTIPLVRKARQFVKTTAK